MFMSDRVSTANETLAGVVLDGLEFARQGRRQAGKVRLVSLPRLAGVLADDGGEIDCEVLGELDREGNAFLVMRLDGEVGLRCQRCLETLVVPLRITSRLLLVPPGRQWPDEELAEDDYDAVEAGKEMALLPMIEEEVLLALPIAPMHDSCETPAATSDEQAPSPFAALAKLRKGV
jgi:uncharacterized protein